MTTVREQSPFVHYRQNADLSSKTAGNGVDGSLDVTHRLCVPCAVVGNARVAAGWSDDAVPLCSGHVEFYGLTDMERDALVGALSIYGAPLREEVHAPARPAPVVAAVNNWPLVEAVLPDASPFVGVTAIEKDSTLFQAVCFSPGCSWVYSPGVKSDVKERASWHRKAHRAAAGTEPLGRLL